LHDVCGIARADVRRAVDHQFSGGHEQATRLQELQSGRGVYCSTRCEDAVLESVHMPSVPNCTATRIF
jgi:hypothetical protein